MTVTIATPDRKTVAALTRLLVDPSRITRCLERASTRCDGARVVDAQCVALPFDPQAHVFRVCGELQLPTATSWTMLQRMVVVLADELRADGFAVD